MGLIYAVTSAFLLLIVLWALGMKQFDATLISVGLMVLATAIWKVLSYFPGRGSDSSGPDA
ncbi:hypothetical protein [Patulibacter minatonensis]|uniref:hypothetical protein n=1 Tax=Patulibacter minatonensis TaxID=298163 RepID=UPI00047D5859|nr:hypothetical protein [Patulibacter minatonensis]